MAVGMKINLYCDVTLFNLADVFHISESSFAYIFRRQSSSLAMKAAQSPETSVQYIITRHYVIIQ
jgi:AraC-like DNA-binding protein